MTSRDVTEPGRRWAEALASWALPDEILDQAPASPWAHPPALFRSTAEDSADTPSMRAAAALLGAGGSLLDVGCGGGRSSLPLRDLVGDALTEVTGVDEQQAMLDQFLDAAAARDITARGVLGLWPADADAAPPADVVVCHHVAYNVAAIDELVAALSVHARRGVVVELPERHPLSPFNPLWKRFWDLDRPHQPSAELFVEIVRAGGWQPHVDRTVRASRRSSRIDDAEFVAFARQRLCLPASRDAEVAEALATDFDPSPRPVVTVWWTTD